MIDATTTDNLIDSGADLVASADFVVVSSSGGIDSYGANDIAGQLANAAGVLLVVVHADMGRLEWVSAAMALADPRLSDGARAKLEQALAEGYNPRELGEQAKAQADMYGARFEVVRRGNGDLLQQTAEKGRYARVGMGPCQGTSDHKRGPIWTVFTKLVAEWRKENPELAKVRRCQILDVQGLAAHGSDKRAARLTGFTRGGTPKAPKGFPAEHAGVGMKTSPLGGRVEQCRANNTKRDVVAWYPLADRSKESIRAQVEEAHTLRGGPRISWSYGVGMPRLSCSVCVFAQRQHLALAGEYNRDLLDAYVEVEEAIGIPFRQEFSLKGIQDDIEAGIHVTEITEEWGDQG